MLGKELIGRESESAVIKIRPDEVRRFAEATGVPFNDRVPPTFVGTLLQAPISGVELPVAGMIHGEQKITYYRQIRLGDSISYKRRVKDIYDRGGKLGKMTFVVLETIGQDLTGELVFSSSSILIAPAKEGAQ
ncbi:MaoC family dehydratase N-terminal domain-containing protein [Desulfosporosinus sp. PR]|uniref:FAS1-like dehydratase domain-containing protein n=1 Tax=Candidatus Desulfosporosinus nitrosoreducens TaxID=3401928 RepID=UPI0027FA5CBC|nr:MaoC family dehydratase N-terminal domain-containing protein [Desulfosporosinus sp. PR]MDQ7096418.1 MaoC family dehydratase N-terminal domain-containing protein [Desulfosporosinus sp. PR]